MTLPANTPVMIHEQVAGHVLSVAMPAESAPSARQLAGPAPGVDRGAGRVVELDALRGLAALAVVGFHYTTFYQQEIGHAQPLGFGFPAGNYGVHLFFLISGFVIFMTLERTRRPRDFVVSRFSRLFPAYWAAIALTAVFIYAIGMPQQRLGLQHAWLNLTMVQQILGGEHLDGSYWTLEVELFFYAQMLLWFMLGMLGRIRWVIAGWLILALAYAVTEHRHVHFSHTLREVLVLRHIPFFAIGILFYRLYAGRLDAKPKERTIDISLIALSLLTIALSKEPVYLTVALVCCVIFGLFVAGKLRWLRAAPFVYLGSISYSLYLLHQAIGFAVIHWLETHGVHALIATIAAVLLAMTLATLLTRWVERPAMHSIRGWWRERSPQGTTSVG